MRRAAQHVLHWFVTLAVQGCAVVHSEGDGVGALQPCEFEKRWAVAQTLHRVIDGFLARSLCRLDGGALCRTGRDGRPFADGRASFAGSDGEWAISGHSGESWNHTRFLFGIAFHHAPRRICEVGFNVGHSAATLLSAAGGNASYLGFDLPRLNPGVNEEFFEMLRTWIGAHHHLEIRWGDAGSTIPQYVAEEGEGLRQRRCDLLFYDGAHDALSVLNGLSLLRRLAAREAILLLDDVRCDGPLCGHSALAWDFLVWAGQVEELHCQSARSAHAAGAADDFGACVGRFHSGPRAAHCSIFDAWCVANTYGLDADRARAEWPRCCLSRTYAPKPGSSVRLVGY